MKNPPPWISVKERYPDVGQDVVYFFDICGTYVGKYYGEHCFGGEAGFLTDDVTHWMPYYKPNRQGSAGRDDAMQELADQAQALDMGYGPSQKPTDALTSKKNVALRHATFLRRYLLRQGCEVAQSPDEIGLFEVIVFLESLDPETTDESAWDRMFGAWVKHQAGLPSDVPLWPNPDWPQDVAMVAFALAGSPVKSKEESGNA